MGRGQKPAKSKEAKPPVARKSSQGDSRVGDLEKRLEEALRGKAEAQEQLQARDRELTDALEQQTATSEILRVISSSPTDLQPVMDAVAENAARVCGATDATIRLIEGDIMRVASRFGAIAPVAPEVIPVDRDSHTGRAIVERRTIHIEDIRRLPETEFPRIIRGHQRTVLATPLMRKGEPIGAILIRRVEVDPFTDKQIELLKTFADQAVIAIENVRLFNETKEALEQQTATGEILRVISSSPTDVQPVFDIIAANAKRLCDARECAVFKFDGDLIHLVAHADIGAEWTKALRSAYPRRPGRGMITARAIQMGSAVHVPDVQADPEFDLTEAAQASGVRTTLSIPMIREGEVIGAITVDRRELKPFLDKEIGLVKTFADQAVIAIENVRLFKELQTSNRELTTALDKQTATSDILRVISQSQTDAQPVFDAIVASAVRLLGAYSGILTRVAGDQIELAALTSTDAAGDSALRALFPRPIQSPEGSHGQAIRARGPLNVADAHTDPRLREEVRAYARVRGFRSQVVVPMLFHEDAIGTISVTRCEPGGFTDDEIALLQTFADQAVIAIENVRLFNETKEALERQTATSEILQVISQSPTDAQPVFDVIARSAVTLCDGYFSLVGVSDGHLLHLRALHNLPEEWSKEARAVYPMPLTSEGGHGAGGPRAACDPYPRLAGGRCHQRGRPCARASPGIARGSECPCLVPRARSACWRWRDATGSRSQTSRSLYSRPSPTRLSLLSRMSDCSKSFRRATVT